MIDFHTHILPQIDDGSRTVEETFKLIKEANEVGFDSIISTSHYLQDEYETNEERRKLLLDAIQKKLNTLNLKLYLGSEIYIDINMVEFLKEKKASTINGSKYVLFELPMMNKPWELKETIYKIQENALKPIIAHPERYSYIQDNIDIAEELIEAGVLFQANYGSILGIYGDRAKKTLKKLLENDWIHFLGSDVHRKESIYPKIPKCIKEIKKIVSEEKFYELSQYNAECVIKNGSI